MCNFNFLVMSKTNNLIWKGIQVICWIIFIGLCVQCGTLLFNLGFSIFKPIATHNLHLGLDLSQIYAQNRVVYLMLFSLIISISALKAIVFYFVLRLFVKLKVEEPFTIVVSDLISKISYFAFSVGLLCHIAHSFAKNLVHRGYNINIVERYWNDSEAYLMMSAILFVIAFIFKRGIELQTENELTV